MGKVGAGDENAGVLDLSLKQSSNSDYKPACNIHGVGNDVRTASSSTVLFSPSTTVSLASPVDGDNNIVRDDADRNGKVSCCAASMATAVTAAATAALFSHSSVVTTPGGRVPSLTCTATATAAGLPLFCGVSTSSPTSERTTFTDSKTTCGPTGPRVKRAPQHSGEIVSERNAELLTDDASSNSSRSSTDASTPHHLSSSYARCSSEPLPPSTADVLGHSDDLAYVERRRKNNEAAKRSRDARRLKEHQTALRAAALERENAQLRAEIAVLRSQAAKLHCLLYNKLGI